MKTLLIRDADVVVTMDDQRRELARASVLVRGRAVEAIGPAEALPRDVVPGGDQGRLRADEVDDRGEGPL